MTDSKLLRFLLIEDDDAHASITMRSLQQNRVVNVVDRVADGEQALEYLKARGTPRPDVILLDLNLPKIGGHEILTRIKADPDLCTIPVVVLTTSDAEVDRVRAYRHHVNSYLVKPIDFERFRQLVRELSLYWGVWNQPPAGDPARPSDAEG
jgi:CheY-like chemotaxis protein